MLSSSKQVRVVVDAAERTKASGCDKGEARKATSLDFFFNDCDVGNNHNSVAAVVVDSTSKNSR